MNALESLLGQYLHDRFRSLEVNARLLQSHARKQCADDRPGTLK